jgi:hypothetical protein
MEAGSKALENAPYWLLFASGFNTLEPLVRSLWGGFVPIKNFVYKGIKPA